jgi:hypothetical protein
MSANVPAERRAHAQPAAPFKPRRRLPMSGVMLRISIVAGILLALSLSSCGEIPDKTPQTPQMRQAVRDAGRQLDKASAQLQRTGHGVGVDTRGCHPRSSLVGCYVASPDAFRPMIAAYARMRLAATIPDVDTAAKCQWAGFRLDCLVTARSHKRTRSSVVQLSLSRDFVVTQAIAPG